MILWSSELYWFIASSLTFTPASKQILSHSIPLNYITEHVMKSDSSCMMMLVLFLTTVWWTRSPLNPSEKKHTRVQDWWRLVRPGKLLPFILLTAQSLSRKINLLVIVYELRNVFRFSQKQKCWWEWFQRLSCHLKEKNSSWRVFLSSVTSETGRHDQALDKPPPMCSLCLQYKEMNVLFF